MFGVDSGVRSGLVGKIPLGPIWGNLRHFSMGRKNSKVTYFPPIFLGGPMAAIHPVWSSVLVSFWPAHLAALQLG